MRLILILIRSRWGFGMSMLVLCLTMLISSGDVCALAPRGVDDQLLDQMRDGALRLEDQKGEKDPFKILESNDGRQLVMEWIEKFPNEERYKNREKILAVIEFLGDPKNRHGDFIADAIEQYPILNEMHERMRAATQKPTIDYPGTVGREGLLRKYILGPTLVNIGAGLDLLGERSLKVNPLVKRAIGVDVERQRSTPYPEGATFRLMTNPSVIPLEDDIADTAALIFVLHHVDVDRANYLKEVRRIIRPGGRLLVLEDTFSHSLPIQYVDEVSMQKSHEIMEKFTGLASDDERLYFLHFVDWFIHNFVGRSREPLVPGNYETMENWRNEFERAGLLVVEESFLGFSALGSRNPVSRGLFVLEKPLGPARIKDYVPIQTFELAA